MAIVTTPFKNLEELAYHPAVQSVKLTTENPVNPEKPQLWNCRVKFIDSFLLNGERLMSISSGALDVESLKESILPYATNKILDGTWVIPEGK